MEDQDRKPSRLIEELAELRRRMAQLETIIEEQRKGEEALRESEEGFRALFETLPRGVVFQGKSFAPTRRPNESWGENPNPVMRVRGDGSIGYANQASSRLLRHWEIAVGQQVPGAIQKRVAEALGSGAVQQWDIQVQNRHFVLTMAPVAKEKAV
jgi:PAS domain-containing protein